MNNPRDIRDGFDIGRAMAYMRLYIGAKGKSLILAAIVILGLYLSFDLLLTFMNLNMYAYHRGAGDPAWEHEIILYGLLLTVGGAVAGSRLFSEMHSKSGRIATLTLPVNSSEKFAVWFLVYAVGTAVWIPATALISDWIRVALLHMFTQWGDKAVCMQPARLLCLGCDIPLKPGNSVAITVIYSFIGILTALMALGSIYIPRRSLLVTSCLIWAMGIAAGTMTWLGQLIFFGQGVPLTFRGSADSSPDSAAIWSIAVGAAVTICIIYLLGWWRLRQSETVNRW